MVVEFLTFRVPADRRGEWIDLEGEVWSTFLEAQPGFVRKELWESAEADDELHAVIWWEGYEPWKAISMETVAAVDEAMGDLLIEPTMRVYHVVRER
jgi:uncharacterized protein (TIGR03792 family)